MLCGGLAGMTAKTAVAPLERLRILAQTGGATGGVAATARLIRSQEGAAGFWRGNGINCIRVFPSRGVLFSCNELYRERFARQLGVGSPAELPVCPSGYNIVTL